MLQEPYGWIIHVQSGNYLVLESLSGIKITARAKPTTLFIDKHSSEKHYESGEPPDIIMDIGGWRHQTKIDIKKVI
jgi:hypothetical protein